MLEREPARKKKPQEKRQELISLFYSVDVCVSDHARLNICK